MVSKLLVANRGEIARRIMRSAREMGISTVAVFSDADAGAPHVTEAGEAVRLPGTASGQTYLRHDLIIEAARQTGADAVHPGYGFLAENAGFARACAAAGITFVGPSADAIEAMGSKIRAKELVAAAGVPTLPMAALSGLSGAALGDAVRSLGWPLLVKASAGGGGRGMRLVTGEADLDDAVAAAGREAASAFGDATVFAERCLLAPRHVEIQVVADVTGRTVSLFERECSIQRRHQKIVEESPSPALDPALRRRMGEVACAAARAVGYQGAGTVEFLVSGAAGAPPHDPGAIEFFFLEMNTRLQVEHPVTEAVCGLDLVRLQLEIASGRPLPDDLPAAPSGHAIEVRLYAEDPAADWRPSAGRLERFAIPQGDAGGVATVRVDAGYETGCTVPVAYDSMLAKVIVHAPDRHEAAARLAATLSASELHGPATNRDLLIGVLAEPEFLAGATDTGYLERHDPAELAEAGRGGELAARDAALAVALARSALHRAGARVLRGLPPGWRNVPNAPQTVRMHSVHDPQAPIDVAYRFDRTGALAHASIDGTAVGPCVLHAATPELVDIEIGGVRRRWSVHIVGNRAWAQCPSASAELVVAEPFVVPGSTVAPGSVVAPMPGTVTALHVAVGSTVAAGDPLLSIEAMKMEHLLTAPSAGRLAEVDVAKGDQVSGGQVLVVIEEVGSGGEDG